MGWFGSRSKKKSGWVYGLLSTRSDGSKKVYVGSTTRTPAKRWGEHFSAIKNKKNTWIGKGTYAKPMGAFWSTNCRKAEQTMKKKSSGVKRWTFRRAASRYKRY